MQVGAKERGGHLRVRDARYLAENRKSHQVAGRKVYSRCLVTLRAILIREQSQREPNAMNEVSASNWCSCVQFAWAAGARHEKARVKSGR